MELSRARERLLRRTVTRKGRESEGVVLVEGPRAIETALEHGAELLFVLREEGKAGDGTDGSGGGGGGRYLPQLQALLEGGGVEVIELPAGRIEEFARTETPQGLLAVAREPRHALPDPSGASGDRILLLDRVQDPGNVGTLIRAAAALGVDRVFVLDGTADPWNAKAVRASVGLAFRLPLHLLWWEEAREWLGRSGVELLVADAGGEDVREWLRRSGGRSRTGGTGSIADTAGAPAPGVAAPAERPGGTSAPAGVNDDSAPGSTSDAPASGGWALLIGNEGDGPRPEALARADTRISIPLPEGVDSLNAATAGAILLWALGPGRTRPA